MLFLQPVVVDDALAADRSAPAEVRIAERASYERMTWTGTTLAQNGPMDGRSPFGPNAPGANDLTPDRPLVNPNAGPMASSPTAAPASPSDPSSTTKIPPMRAPDAGPPPGTTTTNPDTTTDTAAPGTVAPGTTPSTATPGTTPSTRHTRHHAEPDVEHDHTGRGRRRRWSLGRDALAEDEPDRAAGERARSRAGAWALDSAGRDLGRKQHALVAPRHRRGVRLFLCSGSRTVALRATAASDAGRASRQKAGLTGRTDAVFVIGLRADAQEPAPRPAVAGHGRAPVPAVSPHLDRRGRGRHASRGRLDGAGHTPVRGGRLPRRLVRDLEDVRLVSRRACRSRTCCSCAARRTCSRRSTTTSARARSSTSSTAPPAPRSCAASPPSCWCWAPTCWRCCSWRRPASASRPPSPAP